MANISQNSMDTIQECIQKQEKYREYINKINARVKVLNAAKKKIQAAYDANQDVLTSILLDSNTKRMVVNHKKLSIKYYSRIDVSDKSKVPTDYFKPRPVVDKVKIRKALSENPHANISGITLVNYARTSITPDQKN